MYIYIKMSADLGLALGIGIPLGLFAAWGMSIGEDGDPDIFGLFKKRNNPVVVVNYSTGEIVGTSLQKNRKSRKNKRKQ